MIQMNVQSFEDLLKSAFSLGIESNWLLTIWEGTMPDQDATQSRFSSKGLDRVSEISSAVSDSSTNAKVLGYLSGNIASSLNQQEILIPMSRFKNPISFVSRGLPAFFTLGQTSSKHYSHTSGYESLVLIGSIGLPGSSSDMELDLGEFTDSSTVYANDVVIKLDTI
jgi:hypothetical protein